MMNAIWLGMIFLAVGVGVIEGHINEVIASVVQSVKLGFEITLGLVGMMAFWLGMMKIASDSGLITIFARMLTPIMRRLFPEVPKDSPAMGSMILNIAANMLGLDNAATPFGLQAMKELQSLNLNKEEASNAMCTFLAINTSSVQLIPATAIALLGASGSTNPSSIILTSLIATSISTLVAIIAVKSFAPLAIFQAKDKKEKVVYD